MYLLRVSLVLWYALAFEVTIKVWVFYKSMHKLLRLQPLNHFLISLCQLQSSISRYRFIIVIKATIIIPPPNEVGGGGILDSPCPSVCPSVRPSVCRRHGFRSISQVCFGISISNFVCILMVAIDRSLLIFSDVTFKIAAWRPYWFFWFPDSNLTLTLNINFKLQGHNTYVYG